MKKVASIITASAMILMLMMTLNMAFAQEQPYIEVSSVSGEIGETVEVRVSLRNSYGFGGMAFDLKYDNTVLNPVSYELGMGSEICVDSGIGTYEDKINFQYAAAKNVEGDGELVSVVFEIIADEATETSVEVVPEKGTTFYYGGANGRVEIDFTLEAAEGTVTVTEKEKIPSVGETVTGSNLTMQTGNGGDIGVNFNFIASEELRADQGAYIKLVYKGEESKVYLNILTFDGDGKTRVTVNVAAKEMANDITATVYNGSGECGASYTYSVKSYAEYILEHSSEYDAELVSMVKATLNYGAMAQKYFGYETETLANSSLSESDKAAVEAVTSIDVADATYTGTVSGVGFAKHSASIVLGSETTIKHYITLANGENIENYIIKVNGVEVMPKRDGDRYCVSIGNIAAADLDGGYVLSVERISDNATYTATYNVINYVEAMFNACKDNPAYTDLCNLLKAIYLYNDAANTYFGK